MAQHYFSEICGKQVENITLITTCVGVKTSAAMVKWRWYLRQREMVPPQDSEGDRTRQSQNLVRS